MSKKVEEIKQILNQEEEIFSRTFDAGEQRFEQLVAEAKQAGVKELRDKDAWHLYDTYGFPIDLTRLMAEEQGLVVNTQAFEKAQAAEFGEL
jgi:alanyl-tRNA synthetase